MKKANSRWIYILIIAILVIAVGILSFKDAIKDYFKKDNDTKETQENDAVKFKKEYDQVSDDNPFVYKTAQEIINILENGTGIVYFGFPECPWCQRYVKYLEEVAKDNDIEEIYYYNISDIRSENTEEYQTITTLLKDHLDLDDKDLPRVYVPDVTIVKDGKVVGHDNESSLLTSGTPQEYWTDKKVTTLKNKLTKIITDAKLNQCLECN